MKGYTNYIPVVLLLSDRPRSSVFSIFQHSANFFSPTHPNFTSRQVMAAYYAHVPCILIVINWPIQSRTMGFHANGPTKFAFILDFLWRAPFRTNHGQRLLSQLLIKKKTRITGHSFFDVNIKYYALFWLWPVSQIFPGSGRVRRTNLRYLTKYEFQ